MKLTRQTERSAPGIHGVDMENKTKCGNCGAREVWILVHVGWREKRDPPVRSTRQIEARIESLLSALMKWNFDTKQSLIQMGEKRHVDSQWTGKVYPRCREEKRLGGRGISYPKHQKAYKQKQQRNVTYNMLQIQR